MRAQRIQTGIDAMFWTEAMAVFSTSHFFEGDEAAGGSRGKTVAQHLREPHLQQPHRVRSASLRCWRRHVSAGSARKV